MTGDKFVFRQEKLLLCLGFLILLKATRESERIDRCGETVSSERPRDQLDAGLREAHA